MPTIPPSRLCFLLPAIGALALACSSRPARPPAPPPLYTASPSPTPQPPPGAAEVLVLNDTAPGTSSSGFTLTIVDTNFSSGPPPPPGISRPALAISQLTVRAAYAGKTTDLHFTLESPGVVHHTQEEWEGFVIDLVEQRYVDGKPVTRFEIRRR